MLLDLQSGIAQGGAFAAGVLLHAAFYCRGEWDEAVPRLVGVYFAFQVGVVCWNRFLVDSQTSLFAEARGVSWLGVCHVMGIVSSMVVYRLVFHRLRRFPGPFWARISNGYPTFLSAKKLHLYEEVELLHKQYGDFVRLGPSELSITDPAAIDAIYSGKSACTKGPWYNVTLPRISLQMTRNKKEHSKRRKVWDRGFGARALRDYEPRVAKYTDQLLTHIEATNGVPINATDWFNFYSFDVMGDLAFGKSFDMLKNGIKHYFMTCLHADMTNVGYLAHLVWLFPFLKITPVLNRENLKFWEFCEGQVEERRQMSPDLPDIFSFILDEYNSLPQTAQAKLNLDGDAHLIVVAGSDTTAATLTSLFYELANNPRTVAALRNELDEYFIQNKEVDHISVSKLAYLDAIINETLRLHPPVPSGVQRQTPPEGLLVGNTFVPGETLVMVPLHTVFRDERFFERPSEFIPERWTTKPELTKNASVFTPFSSGAYSCVGKHLALMELRYVVAQVVHRYDVSLAPGQSKQSFLDGKRDTFTLALGQLNMIFSHRKQSEA